MSHRLLVLVAMLLLPLTLAAVDVGEVTAVLETPGLFDDADGGDADADDPAIWVAPDPADSLVVTAEKNGGLSVYDLAGVRRQAIETPPAPGEGLAAGRFNNVDLARGFPLGGERVDLAVTTDRGRDQLRFYAIDGAAAEPLRDVTADDPPLVFSADLAEVEEQATAYGLAVWRDPRSGETYAYVSRRSRTAIAQVRLFDAGGAVGYEVTASVDVPAAFTLPDGSTWAPCTDPGDLPQVEGMVVDPASRTLYAGQEDVGLYRMRVPFRRSTRPELFDTVREYGIPTTFDEVEEECIVDHDADPGFGGEHLSADVEGLTIAEYGRRGYLLASSQGDDTFAVYRRNGANRYVTSFAVVDGTVDGVQESDGAAVLTTPLGPDFPGGLLVVQDGDNTPEVLDGAGEPRAATNFKYLRWDEVARAAGLRGRGGAAP